MPTFLGIPIEIRFRIYQLYLSEHRHIADDRQPSNKHLLILRTCRQVAVEAHLVFRNYISILNESQVRVILGRPQTFSLSHVTWADVANDGRMLNLSSDPQDALPLSQLYLILRRMPALSHLRVFECRQGLPYALHSLKTKRFSLKFERAMFPTGTGHNLLAYELFLSPSTRVSPFGVLSPLNVQSLRLSGDCQLPATLKTPALKHVTLHAVTGNYFDLHPIDRCFPESRLESFRYSLASRSGFEIRDSHLTSLALGPGRNLRKLILLTCSRLSSTDIANCLGSLPSLEYFALSLITVGELRTNFILSLPHTVSVFKVKVSEAWYTRPLITEERAICDTIQTRVLTREPPLYSLAADFRQQLMNEEGRTGVWIAIAKQRGVQLHVGQWVEGT